MTSSLLNSVDFCILLHISPYLGTSTGLTVVRGGCSSGVPMQERTDIDCSRLAAYGMSIRNGSFQKANRWASVLQSTSWQNTFIFQRMRAALFNALHFWKVHRHNPPPPPPPAKSLENSIAPHTHDLILKSYKFCPS